MSADTYWAKSSLSISSGVEVGSLPDGTIGVRNSANPESLVLRFTREEWRAFLGGVMNEEFNQFGMEFLQAPRCR